MGEYDGPITIEVGQADDDGHEIIIKGYGDPAVAAYAALLSARSVLQEWHLILSQGSNGRSLVGRTKASLEQVEAALAGLRDAGMTIEVVTAAASPDPLLVAAPEMLEIIKIFRDHANSGRTYVYPLSALKRLDRIVAKAEGRLP